MRRTRGAQTAFLVLFCLLLPAGMVWAQSQATTGLIEGTVVDEQGGAMPGATVAIRNTATNYEVTVTTDAGGRFRAPLLPLGPYRLSVLLPGFATLVREGVTLSVGQTVNLTLVMQLAGAQAEVRVTGEAPVVETSRTAGAVLIDSDAVEKLPNANKNFLDFTKMTPGVTIVQGPDGDELSINGQKGIHNNVSVDGADFNNPFFGEQRGGQRPPFTFNLDAVQEVVVVADGANAEFGRSSSGFVNVVTKSGTNEIHGTGNLYYRDDSMSARPADPDGGKLDLPEGDRWQMGFTLGGPLTTDKIFFFAAADYQVGQETKQQNPDRIEDRVVDFFEGLGSPAENGPIERSDDAFVALAKVDWRITDQHMATIRYNYTWAEQENGTFDVDSWGRSANAIEQDWSNAISGSLISSFSASLLNEFRMQWAREDRPRPYNGPDIAGQDRPLPDTAFDFVSGYRFGLPFFIPVDYYDTRFQINDNVSFIKGNHLIKAGIEYNRVVSSQTFRGFANGRFIFTSTDGFLNYAANPNYVECSNGSTSQNGTCPVGTSVTGPVMLYLQFAGVGNFTAEEAGTQDIEQEEPAVFIQDTWQPMPNLTINVGLRWEAQYQPDPRTPPDEVFFADFIGQTRNGQEFPSDGTIPSDESMWQPRLGISWDPWNDGRTVARATYGIFYARIPGLNLASVRSTNGSIGQTIYRDSTFRNFGGPLPPAYPNLIPASEIGTPVRPEIFVAHKDFRNPRTTAASLSFEREVVKDLALLLKYNWAEGDYLTRFMNMNDPLLGAPWAIGLGEDGTNGIGNLITVTSNARSKYWGWTFGANGRMGETVSFQAYYTYSKDKSDDDNERDPFTLRYAKITDLGPEFGYSDRDQRHRVNAWVLWRAPWAIDVNARYAYRSSQPKSLTEDGEDAATPQDRINDDGSVTQRNLGRKDNQFNSLDLRVSRPFLVGNALTIEPSIEVFNVFNSENFLRPEVTNLIFNFDGTVRSGGGDPRQVQLGLRAIW
jgi:hypothetical protein